MPRGCYRPRLGVWLGLMVWLLSAGAGLSVGGCRKRKAAKIQRHAGTGNGSNSGSSVKKKTGQSEAGKGICLVINAAEGPKRASGVMVKTVFKLVAEAARFPIVHDCPQEHEPRVEVDVGLRRRPVVTVWPQPSRPGRFGFVRRGSAKAWTSSLFREAKKALGRLVGDKARLRLRSSLSKKLYPGSAFDREDLYVALVAGLEWMVHGALKGDAGKLSDYLQVFYILRESAASCALRELGREVGKRLTWRYKRLVKVPSSLSSLETLFDAAAGLFLMRKLGRTHKRLYVGLKAAFAKLPKGRVLRTARGHWYNTAEGILDALVDLYFLNELGLTLSVPYKKVVERALSWKLQEQHTLSQTEFDVQSYLVTHTIYVLSDFDLYELDPELLSNQEDYIKRYLDYYMTMKDVETVGEFGDCLKILGRGYEDEAVRRSVKALLGWQNQDGSWGRMDSPDPYVRYHSTWTAFNGLLEFKFKEKGPHQAWMERLLQAAQGD